MSRRALEARLGRVADRLAGAGALRFPAGPVEGWPGAELRRLGRMVVESGAVRRSAWARLTDADLRWVITFWLGEAEAEAATGMGPIPEDERAPERGTY